MPAALTLPLAGESLITLDTAASRFPGHRGAERLSTSTLTRWATTGFPLPGGGRVKLEALKVGIRWLTSAAAVDRFILAVTPAADDAGAA